MFAPELDFLTSAGLRRKVGGRPSKEDKGQSQVSVPELDILTSDGLKREVGGRPSNENSPSNENEVEWERRDVTVPELDILTKS